MPCPGKTLARATILHILPTRSGGADKRFLNLTGINGDGSCDCDHVGEALETKSVGPRLGKLYHVRLALIKWSRRIGAIDLRCREGVRNAWKLEPRTRKMLHWRENLSRGGLNFGA
jgi:hypothetical protein